MTAASDYDEKLERLLTVAAEIFAEKGYHNASIRDLSRRAGVSLSGLYYYFDSKEELLFRIQERSLRRLLSRLEERLRRVERPDERLRALIHNHISFLAEDSAAMRVLSHEDECLEGEYRSEIRELRRAYSAACTEILRDLRRFSGGGDVVPLNLAASALLGMLDGTQARCRSGTVPAERLAEHLYRLFAGGFAGRAEHAAAGRRAG